MNESTRERNDLQSRSTTAQAGHAARPNVELESTTTTIEQGRSSGASAESGTEKMSERAKNEAQQVRQRAGQAGEQARHAAANAGEQVRRRTRETAEVVRQQAAEQAAAVKHRAVEQVDVQKNGFATKICDVGGALRRAAEDLEQHDDPQLASQTRRLADGIEGVGNHLRDSRITDLLEDTEHFVRRHPAATLGGLFVAGLSLARFLKAQPPRYQSPHAGRSADGAGTQASGGTNPYLQRQAGATPRPSGENDLTMGSSDLKVGSTNPTATHRPAGATQGASSTKPGDMPVGGGAGHASSAGITPATETGPTSKPAAGCPTPSGSSPTPPSSSSQKSPSQGTASGNGTHDKSPRNENSGNRTPGGSSPRPR